MKLQILYVRSASIQNLSSGMKRVPSQRNRKNLFNHPENILISNQLIFTIDEQGESVLITPESVSSIIILSGYE